MTPAHLHILQHSLGLDKHGQGRSYRNRFVTTPESNDGQACVSLVARGLMRDHGPQTLAGGMHCYTVSPNGVDHVALHSPPPPKLNRSQLRYRAFLNADSGQTFAQFIGATRRVLDAHP